jgi:hypothetical protein
MKFYMKCVAFSLCIYFAPSFEKRCSYFTHISQCLQNCLHCATANFTFCSSSTSFHIVDALWLYLPRLLLEIQMSWLPRQLGLSSMVALTIHNEAACPCSKWWNNSP